MSAADASPIPDQEPPWYPCGRCGQEWTKLICPGCNKALGQSACPDCGLDGLGLCCDASHQAFRPRKSPFTDKPDGKMRATGDA